MVPEIHFMLDLETLSTRVNALILEVGIVAFGPKGNNLAEFHAYMNPKKQGGAHVDPGTVLWWTRQMAKGIPFPHGKDSPLTVVYAINKFIESTCHEFQAVPVMWAKGSDFDFPILKCLYDRMKVEAPWKYYNVRDMRTLMSLFDPDEIRYPAGYVLGTAHTALGDARNQAVLVHTALREVDYAYRQISRGR